MIFTKQTNKLWSVMSIDIKSFSSLFCYAVVFTSHLTGMKHINNTIYFVYPFLHTLSFFLQSNHRTMLDEKSTENGVDAKEKKGKSNDSHENERC